MRKDDLARIVAAYRRIRHDLIGRPATIIGRPELTGEVESVSLNPHGVVIVTIKACDANVERKPRAKTYPLRLRLPADAMTYGDRIAAPYRGPRKTTAAPVKRVYGQALDRLGRLVVA